MLAHPSNHLERIKIKLKKDAKRQSTKASHLRHAVKEQTKEQETLSELRSANYIAVNGQLI